MEARCAACHAIDRVDYARSTPLQSPINTFDQSSSIEGLAEEANGSGVHRSLPDAVFREGGNEDNRRAVTLRNQIILQLDPAHAGHLHVDNEARGVAHPGRLQELVGRRERVGGKPERSQQPCRRGADRGIIIDNRDHRDLLHAM